MIASTKKKNLLVGTTVLLGLILMGVMIIKFGKGPAEVFAPAQFAVEFDSERADGLSNGSPVLYRGVNVGRVDTVTFSDDRTHVVIAASIDAIHPPPANVTGTIRSTLVGGLSTISLELAEGADPRGNMSAGQKIEIEFVGVAVLPPAFADLAVELRRSIEDFRRSHLIDHLDETVLSIKTQVENAGHVIDSLQQTIGDNKLRDDLRVSVANIRSFSETADRVGANLEVFSKSLDKTNTQIQTLTADASQTVKSVQSHVDTLSRSVEDRMEQVSKLLDNVGDITRKIDQGQGTAGKLVNDPKLYDALVDTSKELKGTIEDLKRLVNQWEQEGVSLKLR